MTKFTLAQIKALVNSGVATELKATPEEIAFMRGKDTIGYSRGTNGTTGVLMAKNGKLYAALGGAVSVFF